MNAKTFLRDTALHIAASYNNLDIVELLLKDDRLDVIGINRFGESVLELVARNKEPIVRRLCRDRRVRNLCSFRRAVKATSNNRILYFLQEQLIRDNVEYDVRRSARLARGSGSSRVVGSSTCPSLRRSARLSQPRLDRP